MLARHGDLLQANAPVPLPKVALHVHAVVAASNTGMVATVYFCQPCDGKTPETEAPVLILDYDLAPLSRETFPALSARLEGFRRATLAGWSAVWVPPDLERSAAVAGVPAQVIPEPFVDADQFLLTAAGYVSAGRVKFCPAAAARVPTIPFGLDFRAGEFVDDPLRRSAVWAIMLLLEQ